MCTLEVALRRVSRVTGVTDRQDVEELVTEAITEGLIEAQICQTQGVVEVHAVVARYHWTR